MPVAQLTKLHRAARSRGVLAGASHPPRAKLPDLETRSDFVWARADDRDAAARSSTSRPSTCRKRGASGKGRQVLVPQRVGPAGGESLNVRLQAILNPPQGEGAPAWKIGPYTIREGDRVIQTSNDYYLNVMNGEVGVVAWIREKPLTCPACDGKRTVEVESEDMRRTVERDCERCAAKGALPPGMGVRFPRARRAARREYSKPRPTASRSRTRSRSTGARGRSGRGSWCSCTRRTR